MKVCVVGAGVCGLAAIKSCKEENIDVDCFEASDNFGGLWRFRENIHQPSVMKTTVINTSKELSAFSDFPPPKEFANFMHNTSMLEYFKQYAERFDLLRHIKYNCKVVKVEMAGDYEETGRWSVTVLDLEKKETFTSTYDGVMLCIGHHTSPHYPHFEGLDEFQGSVKHSSLVKTSKEYEDRSVLVVGIGNSGADAASDLSRVTKKLYLSTRRGSWVFTKLLFTGIPYDMFFLRRWLMQPDFEFNFHLSNTVVEFLLNLVFDHEKFGLKPSHRVLCAHSTANDALPSCIMSGKVVVKQNVEKFTKDGVVFEGEKNVTPIDDVILATGYEIKYDFLSEDVVKVKNNSLDLYKLVFPPHLRHPSLAFIGLVQPMGSIFPIAEAQSRWYVQLMIGNLKLPSTDEMKNEVADRHGRLSKRFVNTPRHTIQVDYIRYLDEVCSEFGAKPNFWKMALTDPLLFYACIAKPCVSYQYRLQGPHPWAGARDAILKLDERIKAPLQTRKKL